MGNTSSEFSMTLVPEQEAGKRRIDSVEMAKLVDWDGPNDPQNPMNWSGLRKWSTVALISTLTCVAYDNRHPPNSILDDTNFSITAL